MIEDEEQTQRVRTIFVSDFHLGTRNCQADLLLSFLRHHDADTIYLVGDIFDGWRLRNGWYWPQSHNDVVQKLLRKVRKGTHVFYIPGNHDDFLRSYTGLTFGGVEVVDHAIHVTADGKRYLVLHGDEFDVVVRHAKWLAFLGDWAYEAVLSFNGHYNRIRRMLGFEYWSFSAWAKLKVKNAVSFIGAFEATLAAHASRLGMDGVICGHIHHPTISQLGDMIYVNTGDFVESCTAVVEHYDGRLQLLKWSTVVRTPLDEKAHDEVAALCAS